MTIKPWHGRYRCDYRGIVSLGKTRGAAFSGMIRVLLILEGKHEKTTEQDPLVVVLPQPAR